jgi:hypothetical protein
VKQIDFGEYEENAKEKAKDTNIQDKAPTQPQTKPYEWQISSSKLKREATKHELSQRQKTILPLKPRQITSST